jgi:hypothetical protein
MPPSSAPPELGLLMLIPDRLVKLEDFADEADTEPGSGRSSSTSGTSVSFIGESWIDEEVDEEILKADKCDQMEADGHSCDYQMSSDCPSTADLDLGEASLELSEQPAEFPADPCRVLVNLASLKRVRTPRSWSLVPIPENQPAFVPTPRVPWWKRCYICS